MVVRVYDFGLTVGLDIPGLNLPTTFFFQHKNLGFLVKEFETNPF